jgi:hypothetical protein
LDFDGGKDAVAGLKERVVRISPEGFGTIAMIVNFVVAFTVKVLHRTLPRCSRYCGTLEFLLVQGIH